MITLLTGDCRDQLATLPAQSVQCIVTSPPYYGLRKYTNDPKEIGQEATPAAYVASLVAVFAECWRVLREDGVLWLNLGDSYANDTKWGGSTGGKHANGLHGATGIGREKTTTGLPGKNLLGMPWRVAFALQDAGWILRSDIIWHKPNPMPESVTDRPTKAHEYVFLFAKKPRYYYDATAIMEESIWKRENNPDWQYQRAETNAKKHPTNTNAAHGGFTGWKTEHGRNRRSVWTIATRPYAAAHFATMPEALVEPCILAGSSAQACETCGAAWARVVERDVDRHWKECPKDGARRDLGLQSNVSGLHGQYHTITNTDRGFSPACACEVNTGSARSIVLDPFGGAGTVAKVAERFQRDSILIDLNPAYVELQEERVNGVQVDMLL
jgi:DNA modification methylase